MHEIMLDAEPDAVPPGERSADGDGVVSAGSEFAFVFDMRPRVGGRAGQGRAGQGRAGQGRAGQGRAGQGREGQGMDR
jgi:hypothetical protein